MACHQRSAAVLGAAASHRLCRPQCDGRSSVRSAPDERRDGGLDCRAQEPAEHDVVPAGAGRVWLVCPQTARAAVPGGCSLVCAGINGQTASHHPAVRLVAVGLLAAPTNVSGGGFSAFRGSGHPGKVILMACAGEASVAGTFRGQCCYHASTHNTNRAP